MSTKLRLRQRNGFLIKKRVLIWSHLNYLNFLSFPSILLFGSTQNEYCMILQNGFLFRCCLKNLTETFLRQKLRGLLRNFFERIENLFDIFLLYIALYNSLVAKGVCFPQWNLFFSKVDISLGNSKISVFNPLSASVALI